ncbi:NADH-quinone oxidoreductase subunit NuoE [candidate division KSB1 bacterium]|nr:MAG: NADH-quinone oxidoreductase subunit NuoE [candidate division KSB1 bacterium]
MSIDLRETKEIVDKYRGKKGILIPLLQDVQKVYGYVPKEAVLFIAKELDIFPVEIYGILTFYSQFYLTPRGRYPVRVCQGTACHVMGGKALLDYLEDKLGIGDGETTEDGLFTIERVACLGCCGMAPVVAIGDEFHGNCSVEMLDELIESYRTRSDK